MAPTVQVVSEDHPFAELLCGKLRGWGVTAAACAVPPEEAVQAAAEGRVDVILLDIRQQAAAMLGRLATAMRNRNGLEVVLINTAEGITASMEGMRAGASDEITLPLDAATLQEKVMAAIHRRQRAKKAAARGRRSLLGMLEQTMSAATFAQAGEFDSAMEFLKDSENNTPRPGK